MCEAFSVHVTQAIPVCLILFCHFLATYFFLHYAEPARVCPPRVYARLKASFSQQWLLLHLVMARRRTLACLSTHQGFTGVIQPSCDTGLPIVLGVGLEVWKLLGTEHGQQQEVGEVLSLGGC